MVTALAATAAAVAVAVAATVGTAEAQGLKVEDSSRNNPLASPRRIPRIVGGRALTERAKDSGAQFMSTLYTPSNGFYCGAVLVDWTHVLTRAGCYAQVGDIVRVGGVRLFQGQKMTVTNVTNFPEWNATGDQNDLAVLKVRGPNEAALVAKGVFPVTMRSTLDNPHGFYVTGFGAVDTAARTAGSLQLKRGYQPLQKWATCKTVLNQVRLSDGSPLPINEDAQLCTNYKSLGAGALCERDVGGPMYRTAYRFANGALVKVYELYAISSYWVGTQEKRCPQGLPNVGTSVPFFYNWIQAQLV